MAVKNTDIKTYNISSEEISAILKSTDFSKCLDADFIEEAILSDGHEFRYQKKTNAFKYGRNYFVKIKETGENKTSVSVTTQSRKITVLFDPLWKKEVEKVFYFIDMLSRRK